MKWRRSIVQRNGVCDESKVCDSKVSVYAKVHKKDESGIQEVRMDIQASSRNDGLVVLLLVARAKIDAMR